MSDIALNGDHDLDVSDQEMHLVVDVVGEPAAVAQEMRIAMQFHRGEWPLDVDEGLPFLAQVFVKNPSLAGLAAMFSGRARRVPGIIAVKDMSLVYDNDTRELSVSYRSTAQDGGPPIEATLALTPP